MSKRFSTSFVAVRPGFWILLSVCTGSVMGQTPMPVMVSPFRVAQSEVDALVTSLDFDAVAYRNLKTKTEVRLARFALSASRQVDLDLQRIDVFTPDARIVLVTEGGEVQLSRPDVLLWRGAVVGRDNSSVFLSLSPHGTNGWIEFDGERFVISSGPAHRGAAVVYDYEAHATDKIKWKNWSCGLDDLPARGRVGQLKQIPIGTANTVAGGAGSTLFQVQMAIETDFEFTNDIFGGTTRTLSKPWTTWEFVSTYPPSIKIALPAAVGVEIKATDGETKENT